jgi:hypothetical protein
MIKRNRRPSDTARTTQLYGNAQIGQIFYGPNRNVRINLKLAVDRFYSLLPKIPKSSENVGILYNLLNAPANHNAKPLIFIHTQKLARKLQESDNGRVLQRTQPKELPA